MFYFFPFKKKSSLRPPPAARPKRHKLSIRKLQNSTAEFRDDLSTLTVGRGSSTCTIEITRIDNDDGGKELYSIGFAHPKEGKRVTHIGELFVKKAKFQAKAISRLYPKED